MKDLYVLLFLCAWTVMAAEPAQRKPVPKSLPPQGQRYLFIVNTSASMSRLEHSGRQALFDIIYTGLDGYMQTGDTYGVWTFNDQLNAGTFPMQVWNSGRLLDLARHATLFVKEQPYSGKKPALDKAVTAVQSVLRLVKDLNIIIISDEKARLRGTPFDELVNSLHEKLAPELEKTKKPLLITIVARDGLLANATVTLAGEPVLLPPRPATVAAGPASTNAVQQAALPSEKPSSKSAATRPDHAPTSALASPRENTPKTIVITGKSKDPKPNPETPTEPSPQPPPPLNTGVSNPAQPQPSSPHPADPASPQSPVSLPPSHETATAVVPAPTAPIGSPALPAPEKAGAPNQTLQPDTPAIGVLPQPNPNQTRQPPTEGVPAGVPRIGSALGQLGLSPRTVAAREVGQAADPPAVTNTAASGLAALATVPAGGRISPLAWLMAGIFFLVTAMVLAVVFWRLHRNACQPSVITRSLERGDCR